MKLKCSKRRLGFVYTNGIKKAVSARCVRCKLMKPVSDFEFWNGKHDGFARYCKDCKAQIKILKRMELIKNLGGKCCLCGATACLQIHHIVPRRLHGFVMIKPDFTPESLKEVVCLCYDCHLHKAHNGSFSKGAKILDLPANVPRLILNE